MQEASCAPGDVPTPMCMQAPPSRLSGLKKKKTAQEVGAVGKEFSGREGGVNLLKIHCMHV